MDAVLLACVTVQILLTHLRTTKQSIGACLFSTADGDAYADFGTKVAGKGPIVCLVQCADGTVVGGIASVFLASNADVMLPDPSALLLDARQVHRCSVASMAIRFHPNSGPSWGQTALVTCSALDEGHNGAMSASADEAYPTWGAKDAMERKEMFVYRLEDAPQRANADFASIAATSVDTMLTNVMRRLLTVTVGVAALAGSGKSTLLNAFISLLTGRTASIFNAGGGGGNAQGQRTIKAQRVGLYDAANRVHPRGDDVDVFLRDSVGSDQFDELRAHLLGTLRNGEQFNRNKPSAMRPGPQDAAQCVLFLIPAEVLSGPIDEKTLAFFRNLKALCEAYSANTTDREFELRIIPVITQVDEWCAHPERRITDRSCLLARAAGPLRPLYQRLEQEPFCFQPRSVHAIGWLNGDHASCSDADEPTVMALKLILSVAVETAANFLKLNDLLVQGKAAPAAVACPSSGKPHHFDALYRE